MPYTLHVLGVSYLEILDEGEIDHLGLAIDMGVESSRELYIVL